MKKASHILLLLTLLIAFSCSREGKIIPKGEMADIISEMYVVDQMVSLDKRYNNIGDTSDIYEPIFNKYGYTGEDYRNSVKHYIEKPDKYMQVFKKAKEKLAARQRVLQALIDKRNNSFKGWSLLDSLDVLTGPKAIPNNYYRAMSLLFFKPDSVVHNSPVFDSLARYPRVAIQLYKDTIFVDSRTLPFFSIHEAGEEADTTVVISEAVSEPIRESVKEPEARPEKKSDGPGIRMSRSGMED